ncbi:hypothetical protein BP6252_10564 [Coleophoma cylindrospora]|uniref:IgE-binding protein n=1 Tax=Coleophoma cylindrospora TaxID=1849047 RepID=A0A3D8QSX4_9HELO|nr:hypothetical protein BP6252_10564 [Coleophoma cylindrospora]
MFCKTLLASALAGLAVAAPAPIAQRQEASSFSAIAVHSTSAVHLQSINANGGKFWVGAEKPTSTYCPLSTGCPAGNITTFAAGASTGTLSLSVEVPGGQQVYVDPSGALSFTVPHSAFMPAGSQTGPFVYTAAASNQTVGTLTFGNGTQGFFACPDDAVSAWQVYVFTAGSNSTSSCIGIGLSTVNEPAIAAWEYA